MAVASGQSWALQWTVRFFLAFTLEQRPARSAAGLPMLNWKHDGTEDAVHICPWAFDAPNDQYRSTLRHAHVASVLGSHGRCSFANPRVELAAIDRW